MLMDATYLRVKNQASFQHYDPRKRRPPWIKAYTSLLGGDYRFTNGLTEMEQWQLFRIWLVAAGSMSLTLDDDGIVVPVVANDAVTLQRAIMSAKRVPLKKFIRDGWLIPVAEKDLLAPGEGASTDASVGASTDRAETEPDASALANAPARRAGTEVSEVSEVLTMDSGRHFEDREGLPEMINPENEFLVAKLMRAIGDHADVGTRLIVASYAVKLPSASLEKVRESLELNQPQDRAAYAVAALKGELAERSAA